MESASLEFQELVQAVKKYQKRFMEISIECMEANDRVYKVVDKIKEIGQSNLAGEEKLEKIQDIINNKQRFLGFYAYQLTLAGLSLIRLITVMHIELEEKYTDQIRDNNLTEWMKKIEGQVNTAGEHYEHNEKFFSCYSKLDAKEIYKDLFEKYLDKQDIEK